MFSGAMKNSGELRRILYGRKGALDTGMDIDEALEIVLSLARRLEFVEDFDWNDDHAEACAVVSRFSV